jgi:DNA-binding SARP family transcriptional activator
VSSLHITLFGPPRASLAGAPVNFHRNQTLALLAYLAASERPRSRDALATLFWPEQPAQMAHGALRRILYDLGRTVGKEWLEVEEHCVTLPAQPDLLVDARCFSTLQAHVAAHGHAPHHLCDACLTALTEAARLCGDDFLAGFSLKGSAQFDAWQTLTAEHLRLELAAALERLAGTLLARRRCDQALPHARRWLALDPLHEPSHRLLMQLYAMNGDQAAVVRQYMHCTQLLATELGIQPSLETVTLYHKLASNQHIVHVERYRVT